MPDQLIALTVRGHLLAADLGGRWSRRLRDEHGQTTVEWLVATLVLSVLVTVIAARDVWNDVADEVVDAVEDILRTPAGQERV